MYGLLNLSWAGYIIATLILTHITIASVTLYLHRCQAHRALDFHPAISHFFRFWLWLTTGMETKAWTAIHRKHHAKVETEEDPHSPQIFGLQKLLWEGAELYRREAKNKETLERYGEGTPDDWMENNIYLPHTAKGILLMLLLDLLFLGVPGLTVWAIQMMWIPLLATGIINGIGHFWGYRNFESPDAARNVFPWAILIGGEELHNNHHTFPTSAKLSVKWFEFDLGWFYIRLLQLFKLAKPKRISPKLQFLHGKLNVDSDTLKAIFSNRFQVMATYSKKVILPVLQDERQRATKASRIALQRIKNILTRNDFLIDAHAREQLMHVLEKNPTLQAVYQFRLKLQGIWAKSTATQKELVDALQEWCHQAENTGIHALRDFVKQLKCYVPVSTN